jgi:sec-independent protein translocase protein TatA
MGDAYVSLPVTLSFVQGIGVTELLIVLVIVLVIFGPKRLPGLGRQLGHSAREFRDSVTRRHDDDVADPAPAEQPARRELPPGDR